VKALCIPFLLFMCVVALGFADFHGGYDIDAEDVQYKNGVLTFTGNVSLSVGKFTAQGDRAEYHSGAVILYPDETKKYCTISSEDGLNCKVTKAVYTMQTRELVLENPDGECLLGSKQVYRVYFKAGFLLWDNENEQLTLVDDITIKVPHTASLVNNDRVSLIWKELDGKKVLGTIAGLGKCEIQRFDVEGDPRFIVKDDGVFVVDMIGRRMSLVSYPDQEIHYHDHLGHVFSRELFVDLVPDSSTWAPQKVFAHGDVKLLSGAIIVDGELKGATQYVLADSMALDPHAKTLVMKSDRGKRVLYCDRTNHVQMSAPKLVMKEDPGLERPTVKGFGDVRFSLMEQELEQIKKRFYFDEEEQES
jgi:hypothetical protein